MLDPTVVDTPSVGQIPKNIVSNSADLTLVLGSGSSNRHSGACRSIHPLMQDVVPDANRIQRGIEA